MEESEGIQQKRIRFPNKDEYEGGWRGGLPEGRGVYNWSDGSCYEGSWKEGQKHGVGKYTWPSGATFVGEWKNGSMHGVGTFEAPDNTKYFGGWVSDLKHGLGKKIYANGDVYEGLWKRGKSEGPGRYMWQDGNEYDGEWRSGRMHGFGTFKWRTQERYDGNWKEGLEDGMGVFTFQDGSTYDGFWCQGKKNGCGLYRRPALHATHTRPLTGTSTLQDSDHMNDSAGVGTSMGRSEVSSIMSSSSVSASDGTQVASDQPLSVPPKGSMSSVRGGVQTNTEYVELRHYKEGKMITCETIPNGVIDAVISPLQRYRDEAVSANRRRFLKGNDKKAGENIYKGHRSYELMLNLQLGVRWSVSQANSLSMPKHLGEKEFRDQNKQRFPRAGTAATPPHSTPDFKWKAYCPMVFKKLRESFGVDAAEYTLSVCGDKALRELSSPGKSGAIFFISHDDRHFIKTMRKHEVKLLLECLPKYFYHVQMNPHTLLTKFLGLYRITPKGGKKVRFVVMGNILSADLQIHQRYDLKGSTLGRTAGTGTINPILKDLDIDVGYKLDEYWQNQLVTQLKADCSLLEGLGVMDYSMYMGVHVRDGGGNTGTGVVEEDGNPGTNNAMGDMNVTGSSMDSNQTANLGDTSERIAREVRRTPTLRPAADEDLSDELAMQLGHTRVELGQGMSAVAIPMSPDSGQSAHDVVLYFGIIDFLQEYNLTKKVEHHFKSLSHKASTLSAVEPVLYSKRFQDFMKKVFV